MNTQLAYLALEVNAFRVPSTAAQDESTTFPIIIMVIKIFFTPILSRRGHQLWFNAIKSSIIMHQIFTKQYADLLWSTGTCYSPTVDPLQRRILKLEKEKQLLTKLRHPQNPLYNPRNTLLYQKFQVEPINRLPKLYKKFANQNSIEKVNPYCITRERTTQRRARNPNRTLWKLVNQLQETEHNL